MNPLELPKDRLATTDEEGKRVFLHPSETRGRFRTARTWTQAVLILIFLILPWTKVDGIQTVLLNIPERRFSFFGITFWAHDAPLLFFLFAGAAFSLAFVTAVLGRAWCGWACPQTVFIDGIFRRVERWIEGDALTRRQLDREPMSPQKLLKRILKWSAFFVVSLLFSNSLLAYFVGAERMIGMVQGAPSEHLTEFIFTFAITMLFLFDFGWFREQFCIIMCPYGRLQSVLMDPTSLVISYDEKRGEPRKGVSTTARGDCVNCYRCVSVCPTGIDIRRGVQLECIACAACVDACDEMMDRLKRPRGLIRYGREKALKLFQPRHLLYSVVLIIIISALILTLNSRKPLSFAVLRTKGLPYQIVNEETLSNHFQLEANNHWIKPVQLHMKMKDAEVAVAQMPVTLNAGNTNRVDFFVKFKKDLLTAGKGKAILYLSTEISGETLEFEQEVPLLGPNR